MLCAGVSAVDALRLGESQRALMHSACATQAEIPINANPATTETRTAPALAGALCSHMICIPCMAVSCGA